MISHLSCVCEWKGTEEGWQRSLSVGVMFPSCYMISNKSGRSVEPPKAHQQHVKQQSGPTKTTRPGGSTLTALTCSAYVGLRQGAAYP